MHGADYNWALTIFFFSYAAFEIPSNLVLKKMRPSRWLPFIMVCWGTVMTLMGIVQSYQGLLVARFFLGVTEAGLYPGCAYYITMWYCRHEAQLRQTLFFSAASIAGAFSGLLAFVIAKMDGVCGYKGWRWIFICEGLATVVIAFIAFFTIHDFPATAKFLTEEERAWVVHRLKYQNDHSAGETTREGVEDNENAAVGAPVPAEKIFEADEFKWKYVRDALTDWQIWVNIWVYWGIVAPLYGIALFLPTIIKALGYASWKTQLLTIPIYVSAAIIGIAQAWVSDRVGKRSPFILFSLCLVAVGFIMCIAAPQHLPGIVYAGVFIATVGIYPGFPGNITWLSNNLAGSYKRAAGMALQICVGNLAGAMASNFYRTKDSPRYILGHALELGFVVAGLIATLTLIVSYKRINKKRAEIGSSHGLSVKELSEMGDRAPTFRYRL
jgi:MFS family permease